MPISRDEIKRVDADLEDQVRVRRDPFVSVPQVGDGLPIELRKGRHEGYLQIRVHLPGGMSSTMVEVHRTDLLVGLDVLEVED
jgi:hypothetical protein